MKMTTDQAYEILEDAATNTNQWPTEKTTPVKAIGGTNNKVLSNLVTHVAQLTKQLSRQQGTLNAIQANPWELCQFCGGQPSSAKFQSRHQTVEQAQYVSRFNQSQHSNRVSMGATTIRTKIKAKGGVILRIIRTVRVMDGGTIRTTYHQPE